MTRSSFDTRQGEEPPERSGPESAAEWVARMGSDRRTRDDERMLDEWLRQDPSHAIEFDRHAALFNGIGELANDDEARAILMGLPRERQFGRLLTRRAVLAGTVGLVGAIVGIELFPASTVIVTKPGEQRRVVLPDGTVAMLNTDSKLRVKYEKTERRLFLDRGQTWFQVAKDAERPFRVFVDNNEVRALGTAFDIRREVGMVSVTLEEGNVALFQDVSPHLLAADPVRQPNSQDHGDFAPSVILRPGEEARMSPSKPVAVLTVNLAQVQAWRAGRVIFDSTPLREAVSDFNRYGGRQIVLDPNLATVRVSGVFETSRPAAFVESVAALFPIKVIMTADGKIALAPR
jgi:transmembrane sensor